MSPRWPKESWLRPPPYFDKYPWFAAAGQLAGDDLVREGDHEVGQVSFEDSHRAPVTGGDRKASREPLSQRRQIGQQELRRFQSNPPVLPEVADSASRTPSKWSAQALVSQLARRNRSDTASA